ncbi:MAG: hypothetical protein Unbinned2990contig1001_2 [Prokaryotic dsDNA virus sp.]|nr:MAG: hypothetical protein Unbinned2990contig1001_2 [Prokaryotic dsDNA virus sp.]|tara:strand:+ start:31718 stop:32176 length:459 start_codon:yes stop_codon:yes gene_type:complete
MIHTQIDKYPKIFWKVAEYIAESRLLLLGEMQEDSMNDVMKKLIAEDFAIKNQLDAKFSPLVTINPEIKPDVYISRKGNYGIKLNIILISTKEKYMTIDYDLQNDNDRIVNYYWFIQLIKGCKAKHIMIPHYKIFYWEVRFGETEYYCKEIE